MNNKFINSIKIINYKCFNNFKTDSFKQINLIGGQNNVGKTAFIEACYLDVSANKLNNFLFSLTMIERNRDKLNMYLSDNINIIEILQSNKVVSIKSLNDIKYELKEYNASPILEININDKINKIDFNSKIMFENTKNIIFLDNYGFSNDELKEVYKTVQFKDKDIEVNKFLKNFNFKNPKFKIIDDKPYLKIDDTDEYNQINKYGDGIKHYISIICSLYACENGYLFIDEIENGIHYTLYDKLWEIIFQLSEEQNIQVFVTTHSKECIESYNNISQKLNPSITTYIELGKDKQDNIKANVMSSEQLNRNIAIGNGVRGW
ncbi:MAG: AAA family ATPase [Campylobacterota bacterium]|nr:AAA family ATPase [Campylobacterota bacterium]